MHRVTSFKEVKNVRKRAACMLTGVDGAKKFRLQCAGEALLQLSSSIGSLERLFLLSRALLRMAAPRFDPELQWHSQSAA